MQPRRRQPGATDWVATSATVTSSKRVLLSYARWSDCGYIPAEYRVRFRYTAHGRTYTGSYRANLPVDYGHRFTIGYDPAQPARNTGSDRLDSPWYRWTVRLVGLIAGAALFWLLNH